MTLPVRGYPKVTKCIPCVPARARGSGTSTGRPNLHRDRSPTVDDSVGRQDRRYPRGASRGGRNARRTDDKRIILSQTRAKTGDAVRGYGSSGQTRTTCGVITLHAELYR